MRQQGLGDWPTAITNRLRECGWSRADLAHKLAGDPLDGIPATPGWEQNYRSTYKTLSRYVNKGQIPEEPQAEAIALALGLHRSSLPESKRDPTIREVLLLLESIEAQAAQNREAIARQGRAFAAAIQFLANGDAPAARQEISNVQEDR